MAIEIFFRKLYNSLAPADAAQAELMENLKPNAEYRAVLSQPRNPVFHRKAFALANIGFQAWDPPTDREYYGRPILKEFSTFRDELTIRAGFYDVTWTIDGHMRLKPHSWSWAEADQEKFERMYSAFIDVLLRDVLHNYTKDDLEYQVEQILRFS